MQLGARARFGRDDDGIGIGLGRQRDGDGGFDAIFAGDEEDPAEVAFGDEEHLEGSARDQTDIEPEGAMLDVPQVVGELSPDAVQVGVSGQLDLCQAGDAGADLQARLVMGDGLFQLGDEFRAFGSWTDEAHLAKDYIEQLREFIEMTNSEESPHRGDPGVTGERPTGTGMTFAVVPHGSEFIDAEGSAMAPKADLTVDGRSVRGESDGQGDQEHDRSGDEEQAGGDQYIQHALAPRLEAGASLGRQGAKSAIVRGGRVKVATL